MGQPPKPLNFVPRDEWGALPPKSTEPLALPTNIVLFTYTDTRTCTSKEDCIQLLKEIEEEHTVGRDLPDIAFNFMIGGDGSVYEGRGWNVVPFLPDPQCQYEAYEGKSLEIAYIGTFQDRNNFPSDEILDIKDQLVRFGIEKNYIKDEFADEWEWDLVRNPYDESEPLFVTAQLTRFVE